MKRPEKKDVNNINHALCSLRCSCEDEVHAHNNALDKVDQWLEEELSEDFIIKTMLRLIDVHHSRGDLIGVEDAAKAIHNKLMGRG